MENEQRTDDEQQAPQTQDESAEEFKEAVENDPSTAPSTDEDTEKLRGG